MGDFFSFRKMISSVLVKLLYVIGLISVTVYAFYLMFTGQIINGIVTLIIGNILWRLTCEGIIIIFSIHDRLAAIEKQGAPADPYPPQYDNRQYYDQATYRRDYTQRY